MRLLLSNDDGILARGLECLEQAARPLGDVWVVAPDREQSATSHSLTLHHPLRPIQLGPQRWQVDGTPTDCVMLAIEALLPQRPDFVLSGINHGPNMGEDVLYSGTVAAAMEGLALGVPSIAFSFAGRRQSKRGVPPSALCSRSTTSSQCRTGTVDTASRCSMQPMFALAITSGAPTVRCSSLRLRSAVDSAGCNTE